MDGWSDVHHLVKVCREIIMNGFLLVFSKIFMKHFHDALNRIPEIEFLHAQGAVGIRHGEVVGIRRRIEDRFVVRPSRMGWVHKAITD